MTETQDELIDSVNFLLKEYGPMTTEELQHNFEKADIAYIMINGDRYKLPLNILENILTSTNHIFEDDSGRWHLSQVS